MKNGKWKTNTPWFSRRVIAQWLYKEMERRPSQVWNIDDYDGESTYVEMEMEKREERSEDEQMGPHEYQRMRDQLVQFEDTAEAITKDSDERRQWTAEGDSLKWQEHMS